MKPLDHRKLDVVDKTQSNIFGWRGQFTPKFKSLEFDGLYCGGFATIKRVHSVAGFNPVEFDGIRKTAAIGARN